MRSRISSVAMAAALLVTAMTGVRAEPVLQGKDAYGDWQADKPGTVRLIRPQNLARPGATKSVASFSRVVPRPAETTLHVPAGFTVDLFAEGLRGRASSGRAERRHLRRRDGAGRIRVLRTADGRDGSMNEVFACGSRSRSVSRSSRAATTRNGSMSPTPTPSCALPISRRSSRRAAGRRPSSPPAARRRPLDP